jgi:hypothetical protein
MIQEFHGTDQKDQLLLRTSTILLLCFAFLSIHWPVAAAITPVSHTACARAMTVATSAALPLKTSSSESTDAQQLVDRVAVAQAR